MSKSTKDPKDPYVLKKNNWVYQANAINAAIHENSTVLGIRFFSIYQSKLNPIDKSTRLVTFPLKDYAKIMDMPRINITKLQQTAKELISIPVLIKRPEGGFLARPLFDKFDLYPKNGEWYIDIDCHDDMVDYLFDLRKYYFKYKLWNMLRLNKRNHQQMYKFLKERQFYKDPPEVSIEDIKRALGFSKNQYDDWRDLRRDVLIPCQQALATNTDIKFDFEPVKGSGQGGKTVAVRFTISENTEFIDQLTFDHFLTEQPEPEFEGEMESIGLQNDSLEIEPITSEETPKTDEPDYDIKPLLSQLTVTGKKLTALQVDKAKDVAAKIAALMYPSEEQNINHEEHTFNIIKYAVGNTVSAKNVSNSTSYFFGILNNMLKTEQGEKNLNLPF